MHACFCMLQHTVHPHVCRILMQSFHSVCMCVLYTRFVCVCVSVTFSISSPAIRHSLMSSSLAEWSKLSALPATVIFSAAMFELCYTSTQPITPPASTCKHTHTVKSGVWETFATISECRQDDYKKF